MTRNAVQRGVAMAMRPDEIVAILRRQSKSLKRLEVEDLGPFLRWRRNRLCTGWTKTGRELLEFPGGVYGSTNLERIASGCNPGPTSTLRKVIRSSGPAGL